MRDAQGREWEQGARERNPVKVRERLEAAVDHWTTLAHQIPHLSTLDVPLPRPRILFDLKGPIAGMAVTVRESPRRREQWIRINPELLGRYPVRMIQQTVPHEMAHLVVDWYLPRASSDPHGPEWMAVMVVFGRPPLAYHDMRGPGAPRGPVRGQHALRFEAPHGTRSR